MNNFKRNTAITALILLVVAVVISANYYRIRYAVDYGRSRLSDIVYNMTAPEEGSLPFPAPRYRAAYENLEPGFLHCGGVFLYRGDGAPSASSVAALALPHTRYYRSSHLARDMKKLNTSLQNKKRRTLIIPGSLSSMVENLVHRSKPVMPYVRGLYYTGITTGTVKTLKGLKSLHARGINSIVFDIKDIPGIVSYPSRVAMVKKYNLSRQYTIGNIDLFIREARKHKIYTIARIAVFRDHRLVKAAPHLAIQSKKTGGVWNRGKKELWCDPSNREVQDYNIALALELAKKGVDEIQFDYIRFPTVGKLKDAQFTYSFGVMKKEEVIAAFLKRAYEALQPFKVRLSIDIFGVVAWGKEVDIRKTGQRIELLSKYCDCISPMLYPSHFNDDFDGHSSPANRPYYFIYQGNRKVMKRLQKKGVAIRPWLQAFGWKVSRYNADYIIRQMKASHDSGARGFLFWNASNSYSTVYKALEGRNFGDSKQISKLP